MERDVDSAGAPACAVLGVALKGIVVRDDGVVLLIRRSPGLPADPDCSELPGGKMDYGERLVDALAREVREETGLTVEPGPPLHVSHFAKEPFWVSCVTFLCASFEGEVRLSDEHVEHLWESPESLEGRLYACATREEHDAYAGSPHAGLRDR